MKYLECKPLEKLKAFVENVDVGDYTVEGKMEAYSCKLAGTDKKLSRSLDQEVEASVSVSPPRLLSASPVGPLTEAGSRRTLIYLILTLNHIYPDYDFSLLRAHNFSKETGPETVKGNVETLLIEMARAWISENGKDSAFTESLWTAIDEVISLYESSTDIYSYNPEYEVRFFHSLFLLDHQSTATSCLPLSSSSLSTPHTHQLTPIPSLLRVFLVLCIFRDSAVGPLW
mmetsp:Transcript_8892/g.21906  ORF Transcript_8892/g.21906 Transcript_8892/m.21906 type:complete len:229 (+) Transcript_8892:345-1031(+)